MFKQLGLNTPRERNRLHGGSDNSLYGHLHYSDSSTSKNANTHKLSWSFFFLVNLWNKIATSMVTDCWFICLVHADFNC